MKRIIGSILIGAVVPGIAWLGGMEFVRSPELAMVVGFGLGVGFISFTCPAWEF